MNVGYIKVWRKIEDWEWFKDTQTLGFFLYLMLKANYKDSRFMGFDVPRGSLVCGRKKLSEELGLSEKTIRTLLTRLKSTNEVAIKTTNRFSIVCIVNYNKYQDKEANETASQMANEGPTKGQRVATSKEGNKERSKDNGFSEAFESLWKQYPRREGKKAAEKHFHSSVNNQEDLLNLEKAIKNYLKSIETNRTEPKYIKMGSTFFCNWRDWVEPPVAPKANGGLPCDEPFPSHY